MKRKEYRGTRPHLACLKKARKSMKNRTIAGANSYRTATFLAVDVGVSSFSVLFFQLRDEEAVKGSATGEFNWQEDRILLLHSALTPYTITLTKPPSCTTQPQKMSSCLELCFQKRKDEQKNMLTSKTNQGITFDALIFCAVHEKTFYQRSAE